MGRGFGKKKDPFEDLDEDFKDAVAGMDEKAIRDRLAKVTLDQAALMDAKEKDIDLKEKKEAAKEAGAVYREGTKMNKLRVKYARSILDAKGNDTGSADAE
jgi:hypothetical protein